MSEIPQRLAPTTKTLRALFARSGNQCSFPNCEHPLVDEDQNFVANVCHIEDALPGGRFNSKMTNEERRSYENLILFCYQHHKKTDNILKYSVQKLKDIKRHHEAQFVVPFEIRENVIITIHHELKSIKEDTTELNRKADDQTFQLEEIKAMISSNFQKENRDKGGKIEEIDSILKLRDANSQRAALQLLNDFKERNWDQISGPEKYKLLANIGICVLELGDQKKAAEYFIESAQYHPGNDKAVSFLALGYAMLGKKEEAESSIEKAIAKNPRNTNSYLALITICEDDLELPTIISKIPNELHDSPDISYALGIFARNKGDFDNAIKWLQNAVEFAGRNKADLQGTLASTILESVTDPFQIISGQLDSESRSKINYCIQLFSESWEAFKDSDLRKTGAKLLANRGIAKKFLKDFKGAKEDLELAKAIVENNYLIHRHLVILAIETNQLDHALELLDQLEQIENNDDADEIDLNLFRAKILHEKQDYDQAIDILKTVVKDANALNVREEAQSLLIFTYLAIEEFIEAKKISTSIIDKRPNYIRGHIDASKVHMQLKEEDKAVVLLNSAYEQLSHETEAVDIQSLAFAYADLKQYSKAIELLERITDVYKYTFLSRALLQTYFEAGEIDKALKLCLTIKSSHGPIDLVVEIQSTIYESIDDLPKAIDVCEEYLAIYPDDQRIQVKLAIIYGRIKDDDKVKQLLGKLQVLGELPMEILYQLAYLNITVGEVEKGLAIAFETRRKYIHDGEAHFKYFGLMTEFQALLEGLGEIQKVDVDTVVKIKSQGDEVQTYHILEKGERLSHEELLITDMLAQSLVGSSIGDVISIDRNFGEPHKVEIIAIIHRHIYAYQESIDLLHRKFVDIEGFSVFNAQPTGNIKKDFKALFDSLDQSEKIDNQIYDYYHKKIFTIGTCAGLRNQNPIKFWSQVLGNPNLGIYSIGADHTEFQTAELLLSNGKGIVIDLVSILTLASIEKLELLEAIPNDKVIARSSIECIDELIREFKGGGAGGYMTLGKVNGEYVKDHVSNEQVVNGIIYYENILKWVEKNCEIMPCTAALTMNSAQKEEYNKVLGKVAIDSILIAKEHDFLLLADEEALRGIAWNDFRVKGFPCHTLLSYGLHRKILHPTIFVQEVAKLISLGYKFLPVNAEILMKCAEIAEYKTAFPFDLAIQTLWSTNSSEDSSIHVAAEFFYQLYAIPLPTAARRDLITSVLNTLINGRSPRTVNQKLSILIEIKFKLLQQEKKAVNSMIDAFIGAL